MSGGLFLVAEVNRKVGLGHLAELRAVASALRERGISTARIAVGSAMVGESDVEWVSNYEALMRRLVARRPHAIAWSVRTDGWRSVWHAFLGLPARHLWIADIADDYPPVDALVVPTLEPRWRAPQPGTRVFAGPAYFPLDIRGPREVPPLRARPHHALLSLGGADRTEASLRLVPALTGTRSTVVIGPAFRHRDELVRMAAAAALQAVVAPDGLRDLLLRHQLIISAGGNTLFEAAAAGTPALVAWEDPHEEAQGVAFATKGTARVLGRGADVDVKVAAASVAALLASDDLDAMSAAGPRTVDGCGADRIADLLVELEAGVAA